MRIDSRVKPDEAGRWSVWHVERCCRMPRVIAVDDESGEYVERLPLPATFGFAIVTHQARRIQILTESRTILINPLDDATMLESEVESVECRGSSVEREATP